MPENHDQFIDMLWRFFIAADEPPMRKIAQVINELPEDQQKGSANHETVRRTLLALTLPQWETVEVIFLALCQIADVDPDDVEPDEDNYRGRDWEPPRSHRDELHRRHRLARSGWLPPMPRTRTEKARQEAKEAAEAAAAFGRSRKSTVDDDPWGTAPATGSFGAGRGVDEEPPF
ncbi:hypothetical protein IU449_27770 [Nocardia higoensis]|uniref:Uncharacterized protein n=1 Tax=Nocardia higoensis TaxID=228599 RepID=A0ABS0DIL5_9NOCA|nr:hypothetical protein [Nocardia higoensis]